MDTTWTEYFSLSCYLILHVSCTCSYFIWLEVQKYRRDVTHCSCVTDAPRAQLVAHAHHVGRDCHTIYQSLPQALCQLQSFLSHPELLHIQSISVFSSTSYFQNNFCLELEHSERPVSMLFFLTRGKRKVAFWQFIKFCLDQRTSLLCCAKPQCQLSVRYQKII